MLLEPNIGAGLALALIVSVTGTVAPGVSATDVVLKVAEEAAVVQLAAPPAAQVQLCGKWAALRRTVPLKMLLAATFRWYVTEFPGATVWPSSLAVMVKVGFVFGFELGTLGSGQKVTMYPGAAGGWHPKSLEASS